MFPIFAEYDVIMNERKRVEKTHSSPPKGCAVSVGKAAKPSVNSLIADLASEDGIIRVKARRQLVAFKARSVAPLIKTLSSQKHWESWEAAKALSQIETMLGTKKFVKAVSFGDQAQLP